MSFINKELAERFVKSIEIIGTKPSVVRAYDAEDGYAQTWARAEYSINGLKFLGDEGEEYDHHEFLFYFEDTSLSYKESIVTNYCAHDCSGMLHDDAYSKAYDEFMLSNAGIEYVDMRLARNREKYEEEDAKLEEKGASFEERAALKRAYTKERDRILAYIAMYHAKEDNENWDDDNGLGWY